jgi:Cell Wall Hydrolase
LTEMDWPHPPDTQTDPADQAERNSALFFAKPRGHLEPLGILDCPENGPAKPRQAGRFPVSRAVATLLVAAGAGALLFGVARWTHPHQGNASDGALGNSVTVQVPPIDLPPPNLLRPISPEEAVKENAERPFVDRPDSPASRFVLRTDAADHDRALTCLAQAVYYEAAGEGDDGERAVAQVVLNRMRHPGYPASVCGVVYQGADRGSGCQFTFACDGSLLRTPAPSLWARARKIAEQALAGKVFAPVGHATHYHADYVLPYWADSLDKTVQIGRHIFYRLPSVLGDSRSFFQHYAGKEPEIPQPGAAVTLPPSPATDELASALVSDAASGAAKEVEKAAEPVVPLAIDASHGTLIGDPQVPAAPAHRPKASNACAGPAERKQLSPISANDLRAGVSVPSGC